ncbi:vacuolar transporter, partial [Pseudomonas aeruginosa]|nr:vacuolar transporter [Pseudomonas aeruginosa]
MTQHSDLLGFAPQRTAPRIPRAPGADTACSSGPDSLFHAIGLERLNATASMLVRRDNKYVVR